MDLQRVFARVPRGSSYTNATASSLLAVSTLTKRCFLLTRLPRSNDESFGLHSSTIRFDGVNIRCRTVLFLIISPVRISHARLFTLTAVHSFVFLLLSGQEASFLTKSATYFFRVYKHHIMILLKSAPQYPAIDDCQSERINSENIKPPTCKLGRSDRR